MIGRVLDLSNRTVGEATTLLDKTATLQAESTLAEALTLARERSLTRLPVWGTLDGRRRIIGVLNVDHLLYEGPVNLTRRAVEFIKPAVFLGQRMRLDEALRRLQRSGQRLAVVLGDDGGELGVLSLEDILAGVVGEVKL